MPLFALHPLTSHARYPHVFQPPPPNSSGGLLWWNTSGLTMFCPLINLTNTTWRRREGREKDE